MKKKLKNMQSQLVQNEKMVSLGHLVAGIAHEINNPLAIALNNGELLQELLASYATLLAGYRTLKSSVSPAVFEPIEQLETQLDIGYIQDNVPIIYQDIKESLDRIRTIVLNLRNFSRLDEAESKHVNVIEGLESTLSLIRHQLKNKIKLVKDYQEIPAITCYPSQLNQVFMNILVNAIQAMRGKKGEITVRAFCDEANIYIQIADQGDGIPTDVMPHIFEPFYTTKAVGSGTGLGLSISYGIIEKHQGEIGLENIPGEGAMCTIRLPMA